MTTTHPKKSEDLSKEELDYLKELSNAYRRGEYLARSKYGLFGSSDRSNDIKNAVVAVVNACKDKHLEKGAEFSELKNRSRTIIENHAKAMDEIRQRGPRG